jgi:CubicO group peptidase (beta-lactamase class C family)
MIGRRPLLLGAAAAGLTAASAHAQSDDFMGEWNGALDVGSQRLRLRLVIEEGPRATLYSLDQGAAPIAAGQTRIEGSLLAVTFPSIRASYQGRLSNGRIEGEFTQGAVLPLVFARSEAPAAAAPEALTQARLEALRAESGAPALAAAAAKRGGASLSLATGLRAVGRSEAVTTDDKWHLGSITKSMTATLVARCVEAGAASWDDTVGGVLGAAIPEMRADYRDITFRHLLSHRSSLPANIAVTDLVRFPRESADARADRIAYARLGLQQAPIGPKETSFEYSNTGYVIAGAMLEAKLGAPWEALMNERLFTPFGLISMGFGAPGAPGVYDQPVGHAPGVGGAPQPYPPGAPITDNPAVLGPAGRVHGAFGDMLTYLAAHRDRARFLRRESWEMLHTPPFGGDYAMGWVRRGDTLWHNGSNTLWYAEMMFDPVRDVAAAAAANDGRAAEMTRAVGAALLGAAQAVS